ncbi:MAG: hypothetical protein LDL56_11590 [Armatimonadetes bacterium]|nr:hypothetical protein [Armatimonadota bacterium]MCA1997855.1 hypothetical protein [Armatimonadota bacterium]
MSLRINTNIMAMNALRNLSSTDAEMSGAIARLSSGLRINSAADDPSGLIISEGMRAQIRGIQKAISNAQDAVNMAKTADAALDEVQRLLREIRAVAVHAANSGVVDSAQLQADQADIASAIQSINRIADQTAWGTRKLLNGTAGVTANITNINNVLGAYFGGTFSNLPVAAGSIGVNVTTAATQSTWTAATAYAGTATLGVGSFVLNGYTFHITATDTLADVMEKINNQSGNTGVVATIDSTNHLVLKSTEYGANFPITLFDPYNKFGAATNVTGVNAQAVVTVPTVQPDGTTAATTAAFTGGLRSGDSGLKLTDTYGNTITLTPAGGGATGSFTAGQLTTGNLLFQIGANWDQNVAFSLPSTRAEVLGSDVIPNKSLATIDVTVTGGATEAIKIIDAAISQLSQIRGRLGSFQKNFLESTLRSLNVTEENLTASESQIRDADIAAEMMRMTKTQILKQSGMAVLAQANQDPQLVLNLLRGG